MLSVILLILWVTDAGLTPLPKYIKISNSIKWNEAAAHCEGSLQSRLAFIGNANDNNEASSVCGTSRCWFGLTDVSQEGTFRFAPNSETPGYTNWAPNEPNNLGNEDCVEMFGNGQWNDLPCSNRRVFLCDNIVTIRGYIKGPTKVNYLEAYHYCRSHNSLLATITDERDNADVGRVCGNADCWLGFSDLSTEGTYEWVDGSSVTYTNWGAGEPNNLRNEHCGHMRTSKRWNDADCLDFSAFPLCNPVGSTPSAKSDSINVIDDDEQEFVKRLENRINNDIKNKSPIYGIYFDNINVTNLVFFVIGITILFVLIILCMNALSSKLKTTNKHKVYSSLKQINTESEESATDVV